MLTLSDTNLYNMLGYQTTLCGVCSECHAVGHFFLK